MSNTFLLYGSYGYTGSLIAELAVQRGLRPILAGRNAKRLSVQAKSLGLEYRQFPLEDSSLLDAALKETPAVMHCAGPYHRTYEIMAAACLRIGTHYVDITGEIGVFEALMTMDEQAHSKGVMLLPGAGFDVVPTDCLAAYLKNRLPTATHLTLAIKALGGGVSHGTALSALESLPKKGMERQDGRLVLMPLAAKTRQVDFGAGVVEVISAPIADLLTAFHSTGIPNIETYFALPNLLKHMVAIARPMLAAPVPRPIRWLLRQAIHAAPKGPSYHARQKGRCLLWGEVVDEQGHRATARIATPEAYDLTALTVVEIVSRILSGEFKPGFQTPATAYGADLVMSIGGVKRVDM